VVAIATASRPNTTIRECDGASARFSSSIFAAVCSSAGLATLSETSTA
jgi:hypothetical protein